MANVVGLSSIQIHALRDLVDKHSAPDYDVVIVLRRVNRGARETRVTATVYGEGVPLARYGVIPPAVRYDDWVVAGSDHDTEADDPPWVPQEIPLLRRERFQRWRALR